MRLTVRVRPSLYLPVITLLWGLIATLICRVETKEALVGIRFVFGFVEWISIYASSLWYWFRSGFFCGVVRHHFSAVMRQDSIASWSRQLFLLSSWYRKAELAKRMAYFYSAAILSGAFGTCVWTRWLPFKWINQGDCLLVELLPVWKAHEEYADSDGVGCFSVQETVSPGQSYWLSLEGSLTMFFSVIFIFILPNWPANTKWLTKEEKALAAARIKADQVGSVQQKIRPWKSILAALSDWRTYLHVHVYDGCCSAGADGGCLLRRGY